MKPHTTCNKGVNSVARKLLWISKLHTGHEFFILNQSLIQCWWKQCLHGHNTISSPSMKSSKHIVQTKFLAWILWSKNSHLFTSPKLYCIIWKSLKLVSTIFYQIVIFHQMIALQKLWKMFFISSKKLF